MTVVTPLAIEDLDTRAPDAPEFSHVFELTEIGRARQGDRDAVALCGFRFPALRADAGKPCDYACPVCMDLAGRHGIEIVP